VPAPVGADGDTHTPRAPKTIQMDVPSPAQAIVEFLSPAQVPALQEQFRGVYAAAFARPPYNRRAGVADSFAQSLLGHARRAGFRCAIARDGLGRLAGFAYGYTSLPGQWWHDLVAGALGPRRARQWLAGAFELVEFAVDPPAQGRGLGSRLHDSLLAGLPHPAAVLSTMQADTTALQLYRRRGWVTLAEDFVFPGGSSVYMIMGRRLADDGAPG
jgi:ribosomal protein S18 acetylase RimI-like enzyme